MVLVMPSTVISSFHYDKHHRVLEIVFKSGSVYKYLDVPETIYSAMKNAFSKGTYLNTFVKWHYQYEKIR